MQRLIPGPVLNWIDNRFNQDNIILNECTAYDELRAAVNIVLAACLITIGTTYKLPLSTTYVTFMVAMGSSLADRAWGKDSAAYRVTRMLRVIGGWFLTAMGGICSGICGGITDASGRTGHHDGVTFRGTMPSMKKQT